MIAMISTALASGALVGFSLGLVGGGGSILATPLLLYVVGVAQPHVAIGTGALAVSVNAFASLAGHARAGNVRWRCALIFAVVGTLGAFAGSSLGKLVDGNRLLFLFGLIMVAVGALMLRPRRENAAIEREANLATCLLTAAVAFLAGMASGFFGVGGGFLIVPGLMLATRMPMINPCQPCHYRCLLPVLGSGTQPGARGQGSCSHGSTGERHVCDQTGRAYLFVGPWQRSGLIHRRYPFASRWQITGGAVHGRPACQKG